MKTRVWEGLWWVSCFSRRFDTEFHEIFVPEVYFLEYPSLSGQQVEAVSLYLVLHGSISCALAASVRDADELFVCSSWDENSTKGTVEAWSCKTLSAAGIWEQSQLGSLHITSLPPSPRQGIVPLLCTFHNWSLLPIGIFCFSTNQCLFWGRTLQCSESTSE